MGTQLGKNIKKTNTKNTTNTKKHHGTRLRQNGPHNPNRNQPTHSTGQKHKKKQIQKIQQTQKNTMAPGSVRTAHTTQTGTNPLTQLGKNANKIQKKNKQ